MSVTPSPLRRALVALLVGALGASAALTATTAAVAAPAPPTITSPVSPALVVPDVVNPTPAVTVHVALGSPGVAGVGRVELRRDDSTVVRFCTAAVTVSDTSFSCSLTDLPAGDYVLVAQHSDVITPAPSDWSADSEPVELRVGGTTRAQFTDTVTFFSTWDSLAPMLTGVGPAFGSLRVTWRYDVGGGPVTGTYCEIAEIPVSGEWACAGAPFFEWGLYVNFDIVDPLDASGAAWPPVGEAIATGGRLIPEVPSVSVTLGSASVALSGVGAERTELSTGLYNPTVNPGEPYTFGPELDLCGGTETIIPTLDCSFTDLEPGVWNFYTTQSGSESLDALELPGYVLDDYVLIPEPLTAFDAALTADRAVRFSGSGEPGFRAVVQGTADQTVCSALIATDGSWTCNASPAAGTYSFRALQQSVGFVANEESAADNARSFDGFSVVTGSVSVTVPPAPPAPPTPAAVLPPAPTPIAWTLEGYDGSPLLPGQTLELFAQGLPPQTDVVVEIRSTPQLLGTAIADDLGAFVLTVTVPETLEPGEHTLVGIATPPGGVPSAVELPVTVLAPEEAAEEETIEPVAAPPGDSDPRAALGGEVDRSDPAAPSAITSSIPTLQRLFDGPWVVAASGGLALAILLLVAFPAELLTSTLSANTGRLGRWFIALERRTDRVTEWFTRVSRTRALAAAVLVGLTSLIFGFVDPEFGFDPVSIRMTVSLAIGLFLITYVAAWIAGAIARRAWGVDTEVTLQPVALLFAVIGVVVARILEFSPGFLIGLVIGLDLISRVDARVRARVVLLSTGVVVGVALAAWFAFSALSALSTGQPGWVELLISDTLVATTAEGLTAALAALLPLGFLAGYDVFRYSKPLWGVSFLVTGTLFALIVLPTAAGETADVADVSFWMLVMAIFAAVTLTLWALLHFTGNGSREGDDEGSHGDFAPATAAR